MLAMLTEHFGTECQAIEFLRAFAGVRITFPLMRSVETLARERQIIAAVGRDSSRRMARHLSEFYGIPRRVVGKLVMKTGVGLKKRREQQARRERQNRAEIAAM